MLKQDVGFYLGREKTDGFSGLVDENNLFLTIEIEVGITPDIGRELTAYIREKISPIVIENLQQFDSFIANIIKDKNLPSGLSISAGYLKGSIFYLKTVNQGVVYMRRNNKLVKLIEHDETASGFIKEEDVFVFTFGKFIRLLGDESGLNRKFDHRPISEIIDEITPELLAKDDWGTAALFLKVKKYEEGLKPVSDFFEKSEKKSKKTLTFITVFILGVILFWSAGLGYVRRSREDNQKKINMARDLISQKLDKAEEVAFLNISSALNLIADSKEEINKLKSQTPLRSSSFKKQVGELEQMIKNAENKIFKKEEKKYNEFFDLTIDNKNAKGDRFYLFNDQLLILDKINGVLFNFSLKNKSLDKDQSNELKKSILLALFEEKKYFFITGEGVFQIVDGKAKKIIENDKDWGKITDLAVFNGNIYLLDQEKDEIWKYLSTESGFGNKNPYFQSGQSIDLSQVNSLSVDGSIYLAGNSIMVRYTSGLRDEFRIELPDGNVDITKIFTSRDLNKVYGWSKSKGTVYIMDKNGSYQEQINSKILSTGTDMVVYDDIIYVLQGSRIYKIE